MKALRTECCLAVLVLSLGAAFAQDRQPPQEKRLGDLREEGKLKVGDKAPDFSLKTLDGKKTVQLSTFQSKKPVALIFGSYT